MSECDDMPPLEDMDGLVDRIKEMQVQKNKNAPSLESSQKQTSKPTKLQPKSAQKDSFGGMKKGFLFGGKPAEKPKKKPLPTAEKVDFVVKPTMAKDEFVFDEVQSAMKDMENGFNANKDTWLTDGLLNKLQNNKKLMNQMQDPKFAAAINQMQHNPKEAMERYKHDKEVQEFFTEFCQLLGVHFSDLGKSQPTSNASLQQDHITPTSGSKPLPGDEEKMNKILADPEIRNILVKPDIQSMFAMLRNDPEKAQTFLSSCDPRMKADIQKLISVGLIGVESR